MSVYEGCFAVDLGSEMSVRVWRLGLAGMGVVGACIICSGTGTIVYDVGGDVIASNRLYVHVIW